MAGYAYAVARVRALENKLIDRSQWDRLTGATSPEEVWRILGETVYGRWMEGKKYHQYEEVFWRELAETAEFIRSVTTRDSFTQHYLLKYELHNLKVFFLPQITGEERRRSFLPVSLYDGEEVKILAEPRFYQGEILAQMARKLQQTEFQDAQDLQRKVDNLYYAYMAERKQTFSPFLQKFWSDYIDLANLRILLRVKVMGMNEAYLALFLLPGGHLRTAEFIPALCWPDEEIRAWWLWRPTGRVCKDLPILQPLWKVEKAANEYLTESLSAARRMAFGEEPIFNYLWEKENELRKLRILLAAKINNLPDEEWKGRI